MTKYLIGMKSEYDIILRDCAITAEETKNITVTYISLTTPLN